MTSSTDLRLSLTFPSFNLDGDLNSEQKTIQISNNNLQNPLIKLFPVFLSKCVLLEKPREYIYEWFCLAKNWVTGSEVALLALHSAERAVSCRAVVEEEEVRDVIRRLHTSVSSPSLPAGWLMTKPLDFWRIFTHLPFVSFACL